MKMQRKGVDFATTRTSRVDRFAQMSKVEQVIEQKKREIQARLQKNEIQKSESNEQESGPNQVNESQPVKSNPSASKEKDTNSKKIGNVGINIFSNDGSFLDQFKQLNKEKLNDMHKIAKSGISEQIFEKSEQDKKTSEKSKPSRWSLNRDTNSSINNDNNSKLASLRYSENSTRYEMQKNFNSSHYKQSYPPEISNAQNLSLNQYDNTIISTNYPPPSFTGSAPTNIPHQIANNLTTTQNETLHPPQAKPITVSTIPPIQLPNIPPPTIQLNEIPNPKPLDIHNIPPPNQLQDNDIINTDVLKTIPPPNKSIPPPLINTVNVTKSDQNLVSMNVSYPPPIQSTNTLPPPGLQATVPPPSPLLSQTSIPPPPTNPALAPFPVPLPNTNPTLPTTIPPLMAQPILPPIGMNICIQPQINLPPPGITAPSPLGQPTATTSTTIPPLLTQPPPPNPQQLTSSIPPMTVPPPNLLSSNNNTEHCLMRCEVCPIGSESYNAMTSVARMVAQFGTSYEDAVRQRSHQDPNMWFLYNVNSATYQQYQKLVKEYKAEMTNTSNNEYKPEDIYEPDNASMNDENEDQLKADSVKSEAKQLTDSDTETQNSDMSRRRKRKRRSRWGEKVEPVVNILPSTVVTENKSSASTITLSQQILPLKANTPSTQVGNSILLTKITRSDPALIQYAINTFGTTNLSEEDWQKAEDHYKINLLYQDMLRKRQEVERLQKAGKFKYEYDSDEEVEGGTWEHKLRQQEMEATKLWATELTKKAEGKHHIGDFLPPEELRKFLEQSNAAKEGREPNLSDYKEYKLKSDNIGFKMLQKLGWSEGQGLGAEGSGIVEPINKAPQRDLNQGLGANVAGNINETDDEYDAYRKRMMLAYRFRPNPLNNPRRPYY